MRKHPSRGGTSNCKVAGGWIQVDTLVTLRKVRKNPIFGYEIELVDSNGSVNRMAVGDSLELHLNLDLLPS